MGDGAVLSLILIIFAILIYFVPSLIAQSREHRNRIPIFFLNLFLGWSLFGWVFSLVWSLKDYEETKTTKGPKSRAKFGPLNRWRQLALDTWKKQQLSKKQPTKQPSDEPHKKTKEPLLKEPEPKPPEKHSQKECGGPIEFIQRTEEERSKKDLEALQKLRSDN